MVSFIRINRGYRSFKAFKLLGSLVVSLLVSNFSWSATTSLVSQKGTSAKTASKVKALAEEYYTVQAQGLLGSLFAPSIVAHEDRCQPRRPDNSCVDAVCARMPSYNCDDISEIREVAKVCANQIDGRCIEAACKRMPSFNCDDLSEIKQVAQSCEGQYDHRCVDAVCGRMASYNCDDISELRQVGDACRGFHNVGCLDSVCNKMASYSCDDLSELQQVIKTCKGQ